VLEPVKPLQEPKSDPRATKNRPKAAKCFSRAETRTLNYEIITCINGFRQLDKKSNMDFQLALQGVVKTDVFQQVTAGTKFASAAQKAKSSPKHAKSGTKAARSSQRKAKRSQREHQQRETLAKKGSNAAKSSPRAV
jgi:hypothetical protein